MKDTLILTVYCSRKRIKLYACAPISSDKGIQHYSCTTTGGGWNVGGFRTAANPAVMLSEAKRDLRASHPRAAMREIFEDDPHYLLELRNDALEVLNEYTVSSEFGKPANAEIYVKFADRDGVIHDYYTSVDTFKTYLRPLGFSGAYVKD